MTESEGGRGLLEEASPQGAAMEASVAVTVLLLLLLSFLSGLLAGRL